MARSIWSGSIGFGLVNVPVRLYSAVSQKEVRFHMLHDEDGARIQFKRVCSADGQEVPWEHIVKGFELSRDQYVRIEPHELEALDPKATRTIEIEDFVDLASIDPIYYETTYHLLPDRGAARAYALLVEAMTQSGKVAIARMVMRTRQYLCAVRPKGRALMLSTMLYADEVVDASELEVPEPAEPAREREVDMARQLVESLSTDFDPSRYRDEYRERVRELVERKAEGHEIVVPPSAPAPAQVVNLADALRASLEAAKKRPPRIEHREEAAAARRSSPPRQQGLLDVVDEPAAKTRRAASRKRKSP